MQTKKLEMRWDDISKLEINSMLVDGIWGRKMPASNTAFCEIISAWVFQLNAVMDYLNNPSIESIISQEKNTNEQDIAAERKLLEAANNWQLKKPDFFEKFGEKEKHREKKLASIISDNNIMIVLDPLRDVKAMNRLRKKLCRIARKKDVVYCNAQLFHLLRLQTRIDCLLQAYSEAKEEADVNFRDRQELRKLWELKDGYIFAQNIIQLDGDVIYRINRRMYRDSLSEQFRSDLLAFHQQNVNVAMGNWQFLVETMIALAKAVFSGLKNAFLGRTTGFLKIS